MAISDAEWSADEATDYAAGFAAGVTKAAEAVREWAVANGFEVRPDQPHHGQEQA